METQVYTTTIRGSLGTINAPPVTISGDASVTIGNAADASDTLIETVAVDKDLCVAFYLWCDQDVTVTTNAGADTFDLNANEPYWWHGDAGDCPLSADITSVHVNNSANQVAANFKAEFLLTVAS